MRCDYITRLNNGKSKRVNIALCSRMLIEAARDSFDVAVLIAGDEDYVPLVEGMKEMKKAVYLTFFDHPDGGLSDELRLASDMFFDITGFFFERWAPTPPDELSFLTSAPSTFRR